MLYYQRVPKMPWLLDILSPVIASATLTLLSGHSLNIAKNWRLLIYSSSNLMPCPYSGNRVRLTPASPKSFKASRVACRRSNGCSRNTSTRSLVLGNSISAPFWNAVAQYVTAKMVGKIFSALIPSHVDTTSSTGVVADAATRGASATRYCFNPKTSAGSCQNPNKLGWQTLNAIYSDTP